MSRHLLIVGAGITGLAAAWQAASTPDVDVTVIDTAPRVGGKIATSPLAGLSNGTAIDEGADAFLARVPHAIELCEELGLSDQLVEPSVSRAQVWVDGSAGSFDRHGSRGSRRVRGSSRHADSCPPAGWPTLWPKQSGIGQHQSRMCQSAHS